MVSADRAKQSGGPKLPLNCAKFGVTHILLSQPMSQLKQFEKARTILALWNEFMDAAVRPKGTKFLLRYTPTRQPWLEAKPYRATDPGSVP